MRLLAALLLGYALSPDVATADGCRSKQCCRLELDKARYLREWAAAFEACNREEDPSAEACELADVYGDRYHELVMEFGQKCEPPQLRAE